MKQISPFMHKLDFIKNQINATSFVRVFNVQKSGHLLMEHYPQISVMQGIEDMVESVMGKWLG